MGVYKIWPRHFSTQNLQAEQQRDSPKLSAEQGVGEKLTMASDTT